MITFYGNMSLNIRIIILNPPINRKYDQCSLKTLIDFVLILLPDKIDWNR